VLVAVVGGHRAEEDLDVLDAALVVGEGASGDGGAVAAIARLGVAPEDGPVRGKVRAEGDVEQAALTAGVHLGEARDGRAEGAVGGDEAEAARPLGDEETAVRQRLDGPRVLEAGG